MGRRCVFSAVLLSAVRVRDALLRSGASLVLQGHSLLPVLAVRVCGACTQERTVQQDLFPSPPLE